MENLVRRFTGPLIVGVSIIVVPHYLTPFTENLPEPWGSLVVFAVLAVIIMAAMSLSQALQNKG